MHRATYPNEPVLDETKHSRVDSGPRCAALLGVKFN